MRKVIWNKIARLDYYENIDYLLRKWSEKEAQEFIDEVYEKHKNDTVVLVSHGSFSKALTAVIIGKDYSEVEMLSNTGVSIFEIDEDKNHKIILHNCTKHLDM